MLTIACVRNSLCGLAVSDCESCLSIRARSRRLVVFSCYRVLLTNANWAIQEFARESCACSSHGNKPLATAQMIGQNMWGLKKCYSCVRLVRSCVVGTISLYTRGHW